MHTEGAETSVCQVMVLVSVGCVKGPLAQIMVRDADRC